MATLLKYTPTDRVAASHLPTGNAIRNWGLAACIVIVAAHVPHLFAVWKRMWAVDHYQFFPMVYPAAAYLAWPTLKSGRSWRSAVGTNSTTVFLPAAGILTIAAVIDSPWLGVIGGMIFVLSFVRYFTGRRRTRALIPVWLFLWLAVPLPLGIDEQLILWLQRVATDWASAALDVFGFRHAVAGVVIELPHQRFLVEEACSGIHSLFAAVSCVGFYLILMKRRLLRSVFVLAATIFWVVAANATRITLVTILSHAFQLPVTEGLGHELLGAIVFVLCLLLVASSDRILMFLWPESAQVVSGRRRWWQIWKPRLRTMDSEAPTATATRSAQQSMAGVGQTVLNDKNNAEDRTNRQPASGTDQRPRSLPLRPSTRTYSRIQARSFPYASHGELIAITLLFSIPLAIQTASAALAVAVRPVAADQQHRLSVFDEGVLPATWNGWQREGFEAIVRDPDDPNGQFSYRWLWRRDGRTVSISFDGPFVGWHNLANCLIGQGWSVGDSKNHKFASTDTSVDGGGGGGFTELSCQRDAGRFSHVVFTVFDRDFQPYEPPETYLGFRAVRRFPKVSSMTDWFSRNLAGGTPSAGAATAQVHLFAESYVELTERERQDDLLLFHAMRLLLMPVPNDAAPVNASESERNRTPISAPSVASE